MLPLFLTTELLMIYHEELVQRQLLFCSDCVTLKP